MWQFIVSMLMMMSTVLFVVADNTIYAKDEGKLEFLVGIIDDDTSHEIVADGVYFDIGDAADFEYDYYGDEYVDEGSYLDADTGFADNGNYDDDVEYGDYYYDDYSRHDRGYNGRRNGRRIGRRNGNGNRYCDCKCDRKIVARCNLQPVADTSEIHGVISFESSGINKRTEIYAEIKGLSPGFHGFHIHQEGDISEACNATLGHYNPFNRDHGAQWADERHVGDLGNIYVNADGDTVFFNFMDSQVKLDGPYSVIGRSVVIHADEDDLGLGNESDSLTTGHAGSRIACCVIFTAVVN